MNPVVIVAIISALFGAGGFITAIVSYRKNDGDERSKARDELWKELGAVRVQVATLTAQVRELERKENEYLKQLNVKDIQLESEKSARIDAEHERDQLAQDLAAMSVERDKWETRYEKLESRTDRFKAIRTEYPPSAPIDPTEKE